MSNAGRSSRRCFLSACASGATAVGFPTIVRSAGPLSLRWQSAWSDKEIFQEFALDFARKVNDMTGGDLKIQILPAGAVVPGFGLLDAVSKGALDGAHGALVYHANKQAALGLWGSGPAFAMDANTVLAWHKYGGGRALLNKVYASIGANVVSFLYGPHPTQPLGWFKKPIANAEDFKGLKYRTVGLAIDMASELGAIATALPGNETAAAIERTIVDAAEFNNATSDRQLGLAAKLKVCMLQSFHQNGEQFEVLFNKAKYDALPDAMKSIVENAVDAASADMSWKAIDRYSRDYIELQTIDKVKFYKTPDPILQRQLEAFDKVTDRKSMDNPLFKEVVESQKVFAERAVRWDLDVNANRRMAYAHYFAPKVGAKKS
jgi:TRAP-type mannitol/chloroaromatic compound transport system substrate-binding protein